MIVAYIGRRAGRRHVSTPLLQQHIVELCGAPTLDDPAAAAAAALKSSSRNPCTRAATAAETMISEGTWADAEALARSQQ
jgi:hypothetical protein